MQLQILGDGQVWDVKEILPDAKEKTFEDLFSGRALGRIAREFNQNLPANKRVLSQFKEKGKITGISVTKALLSNNPEAQHIAGQILKLLAQNAARGIDALYKGKAVKPTWSPQDRDNWRKFDIIIIGGGVSEGKTGRTLVRFIKKYLSKRSLAHVAVCLAKFPGKEAGFIGALINIRKLICKEAKQKSLKSIAGIGLDLGRQEIGVGLLSISPESEGILKGKKNFWLFKHSVKTPYPKYLKAYLDARQDYTRQQRDLGIRIRTSILKQMARLVMLAKKKAKEFGLENSKHIAVAVPGRTHQGYILDSTDYLPFFRKKDGFNFTCALQDLLHNRGMQGYKIHLINDGIAAGIANVYSGGFTINKGKFAFLGAGSGLGGCVGLFTPNTRDAS